MKFTKDTSGWKRVRKEESLQDIDKKVVQVGFFDTYYGPENYNLPVATVAMWNEEGEGVPMRSFIRAGFIETLKSLMNLMSKFIIKLDLWLKVR